MKNDNRVGKLYYAYDAKTNEGTFITEIYERQPDGMFVLVESDTCDTFAQAFGCQENAYPQIDKYLKNGLDLYSAKAPNGRIYTKLDALNNQVAIGEGNTVEESFRELDDYINEYEDKIAKNVAKIIFLTKAYDKLNSNDQDDQNDQK